MPDPNPRALGAFTAARLELWDIIWAGPNSAKLSHAWRKLGPLNPVEPYVRVQLEKDPLADPRKATRGPVEYRHTQPFAFDVLATLFGVLKAT